jgi:hypothetical protein
VPVIPVPVAAGGAVTSASSTAKGIDLTGTMTLKGITSSSVGFTATAVETSGVGSGDAPDDLLVTFYIDKAEFSVHARGKLSDDGSKFVFTGGKFTVSRPGNLIALGLAKSGGTSGTVGLKTNAPVTIILG